MTAVLALTASRLDGAVPLHPHSKRPAFRERGWRGIPWGASPAQIEAGLRRARIPFQRQPWIRGHFPAGPGRRGGGCVRFDRWTARVGPWRAQLEARWGRLYGVSLSRPLHTLREADAIVASLRARLGRPQLLQNSPLASLRAVWSNATTQVELHAQLLGGKPLAWQQHQSLPRGYP